MVESDVLKMSVGYFDREGTPSTTRRIPVFSRLKDLRHLSGDHVSGSLTPRPFASMSDSSTPIETSRTSLPQAVNKCLASDQTLRSTADGCSRIYLGREFHSPMRVPHGSFQCWSAASFSEVR